MKRCLLTIAFTITMYCGFSQIWGDNGSRTEYRDDAGLQGDAGARSGFYNTEYPVNFPTGASSWWHLLDVRHITPTNNYAMQFAGSFYDQNLYFRKTNHNPAQPWSKVVLQSAEGNINVESIDVNATNAIYLTSIGTGTFNRTVIHNSAQHGFLIERARLTDEPNGEIINFAISRRGGGIPSLIITGNDNVGIGITSPTEKLSVNGNIRSRKVIVTQTGWPDYVFEPTYQLPSLDSVHNFIKENKHLPGMAPAAVVEKEGLDLGEVVKQQQQKIEELMLYMIEMKKENETIKKDNTQLKTQNEQLEKRVQQIEKNKDH